MQNYCSAWSQLQAVRSSAAGRSVAAAVKIFLTSRYYTELHRKCCTLKISHPQAFDFSTELFWYSGHLLPSPSQSSNCSPCVPPSCLHAATVTLQVPKVAPTTCGQSPTKWYVLQNTQNSVCLLCLELDATFTAECLLPRLQHPTSALSP